VPVLRMVQKMSLMELNHIQTIFNTKHKYASALEQLAKLQLKWIGGSGSAL